MHILSPYGYSSATLSAYSNPGKIEPEALGSTI